MNLTKEHIAIMKHTRDIAARGYYCGDSPEMRQLVDAGLMVEMGKAAWCPDPYFKLTPAGRNELAKHDAAMLRDQQSVTSTPKACLRCGRPLRPAPARADGEPTSVGFLACVCSRIAFLDGRHDGETYAEYLGRMNTECPPPPPTRARRPHESRGSAASNACLGAL